MAGWFSNVASSNSMTSLAGALAGAKDRVTAGLKEAFDTEEIDEEYLNDETEDPLDRLHLARSKLASAQKVIQSHESKIQTLTDDHETFKDKLKSTEDRLNQFKDLLAEKDSEIVQVAEEKDAEIEELKSRIEVREGINVAAAEPDPVTTAQFPSEILNFFHTFDLKSSQFKEMQESLQSSHNFDFERVLIESLQRLDTSLLEPSSASKGTLENNSNEEVTTLKDELKQREDQCERLELDRSQLSLQLEAAESALSELRQSHEDVLCKKEELLRGCDERIAALETKLNERVEQSHQSNAGVSLVDGDDASSAALLENECSELKEKLEELLKELSKVKQENQEMHQSQASSKDLQDEVNRLTGEIEGHKQAIQATETFSLDLEHKLSKAEKEKLEKEKALTSALESSTAETQSLRTQVMRLEEAEANFLAERDQMEEETQRLQQEVADCQDTIDTLSKQLNQAADSDRQDVAELKSEVERLNSELSQQAESVKQSEQKVVEHLQNESEGVKALEEKSSELKAKVESLESKNKDLEEELALSRDSLNQQIVTDLLEQLNSASESNLQDLTEVVAEFGKLTSSNVELRNEVKSGKENESDTVEKLRSEIGDLQASKVTLESEAEELRAHIKGFESQSQGFRTDLLSAKVMNDTLNRQIDELNVEIEIMKESDDGIVEQLRLEIEESRSSKANLESLVNELKNKQESDVKSLEFQSAELKTELVQAKEMNEVLNKQLEELVRITENEDSKLDALTKELLNLKESENEYQAQLKAMREQEAKTIASTELYKRQYEQLLEEYNQYLEDLDKMQAKVKDLEDVKIVLEKESAVMEETSAQLRRECGSLKEELAKSKDQIDSLSRELEAAKKDSSEPTERLTEEVESLKSKLKSVTQTLQTEEERVKELEKSLADEKQDNEFFRSQLQNSIALEEKQDKESSEKVTILEEQIRQLQAEAGERQQMVAILNEKTRENSKLKKENGQFLQRMADSGRNYEEKISCLSKEKIEKEELSKATVQKLSQLVRDKDLELESLRQKNSSLVQIVEENSRSVANEKANAEGSGDRRIAKATSDNSNEIVALKDKIAELETKLGTAQVYQTGDNRTVAETSDHLVQTLNKSDCEAVAASSKELMQTKEFLRNEHKENADEPLSKAKFEKIVLQLSETTKTNGLLKLDLEASSSHLTRLKLEKEEREHDLKMARMNLEKLTSEVRDGHTKKQQDDKAIQELKTSQAQLMKEKSQAQSQLADKNREMTGLRREVNSVIDKKKKLEGEVERLKHHLMTVEETYTHEALEAAKREDELRTKLIDSEEQLRSLNAAQSNTSRVTTVHVQGLEAKVAELTREAEVAKSKVFSMEAEAGAHQRALDNLNMALEGFQHEKANELRKAEIACQQRLALEAEKQSLLEADLAALRDQLENANEGLKAANRLGDQLDAKTRAVSGLKQDLAIRDDLLAKAHRDLEAARGQGVAKVDRYLVKNLVVGYATADTAKKPEVMKILATVLDFNQEERDKAGINTSGQGWLKGWFGGSVGSPVTSHSPSSRGHSRTSSEVQAMTGLDQSLAQAFVQFLEVESKPKPVPELPTIPPPSPSTPRQMTTSTPPTATSTPSVTPVPGSAPTGTYNNAIFSTSHGGPPDLPTFAHNRSSSAILKNVLQTNEQPQHVVRAGRPVLRAPSPGVPSDAAEVKNDSKSVKNDENL